MCMKKSITKGSDKRVNQELQFTQENVCKCGKKIEHTSPKINQRSVHTIRKKAKSLNYVAGYGNAKTIPSNPTQATLSKTLTNNHTTGHNL